MSENKTFKKAVDTVRLLASDAVQKAKSGHPGMPMGCADYAFTLWHDFLRHNPENPQWLGRDRFILSAGHGSMLLYSLLHMFEYDLPLSELQQFRQWQSKTPGHPEFGHTPGVEVTTGPLGTGFASGVGMAIAAKQLGARLENPGLFDQRIFVLSGDGCMMEGVTSEAASLAGHNKLDNLIVFYDSNGITIEGSTQLAFTEDVGKRFQAYGWHVLRIDGQNVGEIRQALKAAIAFKKGPTIIIGTTTIGYGAPNKAGHHSSHGEPLGEDEMAAAKAALGFAPDRTFIVDDDVRALCRARVAELKRQAAAWDERLAEFCQANPEQAELLNQLMNRTVPANILDELLAVVPQKDGATRQTGGLVLNRAAALVPCITGGAADLNPSTKTRLEEESDFCVQDYAGRNVHFGVREFAMGLCANGMALYGTAIPFTATFAVFSDFMKPAMRLAALQKIQVAFVFTHDSIFVGEDGPTHQPIEHLAMCRSIPGMTVLRPAEAHEAAHAWAAILTHSGPSCLFLTRQTLKNIAPELRGNIAVAKGAYVLSDDSDFEVIIIATGSEVMVASDAAVLLRQQGRKVRVVSMPSWELFDKQDAAYRNSVLPPTCRNRVSLEAGSTFGWCKYTGSEGLCLGIDHFGDSAPAGVLAEKYGFNPEAVAAKVQKYLG